MKNVFLFLLITSLTQIPYPLRTDYKEIQLNKKFPAIKSSNKYKIQADTAKNTWLITGDSLTIFTLDVERFEVTVDKNNTIKQIEITTKDIFFKDYEEWSSNLKQILTIANGDVGKENSDDLSRSSSNQLWLAWSFANTKTALSLKTFKVNRSAKNFKRSYVFSWREEKKFFYDAKY